MVPLLECPVCRSLRYLNVIIVRWIIIFQSGIWPKRNLGKTFALHSALYVSCCTWICCSILWQPRPVRQLLWPSPIFLRQKTGSTGSTGPDARTGKTRDPKIAKNYIFGGIISTLVNNLISFLSVKPCTSRYCYQTSVWLSHTYARRCFQAGALFCLRHSHSVTSSSVVLWYRKRIYAALLPVFHW